MAREREWQGGFWRQTGRVYLFTLLAAVLCFFLYLTVGMLVRAAGVEDIGYVIVVTMDDGTTRQVVRPVETVDAQGHAIARETAVLIMPDGSERLYCDVWYTEASVEAASAEREALEAAEQAEREAAQQAGETTKAGRPQAAKSPVRETVRSELSAAAQRTMDVIMQPLMVILLLAFAYSQMWHIGSHDAGQVQFGRMKRDPWKGLRMGAAVMLPTAGLYLLAVLSKASGVEGEATLRLFKLSSACWMPLFQWLFPAGYTSMAQVSWWGLVDYLWTLLPLPLAAAGAYWLGLKGWSVRERVLYTGKRR